MTHPDRREPASEAAGPPARPAVDRMALRPKDLETAIGVDERTIQRWRSSGRFPKPDIAIGRTLLWRTETIRDWLARGGDR
jgi:predicted DNA-binding transcriptional regulator AlpA